MTSHDRTDPPTGVASSSGHAPAPRYEIRVDGHLDARWSAWFDGMDLITHDDGTSVLRGPVVDQAALHGVLDRLRDIGIPLRSLSELESDELDTPGAPDAGPDLPNQASPHTSLPNTGATS